MQARQGILCQKAVIRVNHISHLLTISRHLAKGFP